MIPFHKNNIDKNWEDLILEFPEFFIEPSTEIKVMFHDFGGCGCDFPNTIDECVNLRYGFECGLGWKKIIWDHCNKIRLLIQEASNNGHDVVYKSFIMKQKHGEARDQGDFYGKDHELYLMKYNGLVHSLQEKSTTTCEMCGATGRIRRIQKKDIDLKCLCDKHFKDVK